MGHLKTLSLKAMANGLPLFVILIIGNVYWVTALFMTLLLSGLAYIIGDLFILPATGNKIATLADGVLVFLTLYSARYFGVPIHTMVLVYAVIAVLIIEALFYHPYLKRLVSLDSQGPKLFTCSLCQCRSA